MLFQFRQEFESIPQLRCLICAVFVPSLILLSATQAGAFARWSGSYFLQDSYSVAGEESVNLFSAGLNLNVKPATKKMLNTQLTAQFRYTTANGEVLWNASPLGNIHFSLIEPGYALRIENIRQASLNTAAQLVQSNSTTIGLTWQRESLPAVDANWSIHETSSNGREARVDTYSMRTSYQFHWLNFRAGYAMSESQSDGGNRFTSKSYAYGVGGSYPVFPRTTISGDLGFTGNSSSGESSSGRSINLGFSSAPLPWINLGGQYNSTMNSLNTRNTSSTRQFNVGILPPLSWLRVSTSAGRQEFNDRGGSRAVDFVTLSATFDRRLRENIDFNTTVSRSWQDDPEQGRNISDSISLNTGMQITPRIFFGASLTVGRSEVPGFVSGQEPQKPDASGPFADRSLYDTKPAGFIFLDTDNRVLYIRDPFSPTGWSDPTPYEPPPDRIERFSISKSARFSARITDRSAFSILYAANASGEKLDLLAAENERLSGSLSYRGNARTNYSLSGSASFSERGSTSYGASASITYVFLHGHRMDLNYGVQFPEDKKSSDSFSANFTASLGRRGAFRLTYSTSQLFEREQSTFVKASFNRNF